MEPSRKRMLDRYIANPAMPLPPNLACNRCKRRPGTVRLRDICDVCEDVYVCESCAKIHAGEVSVEETYDYPKTNSGPRCNAEESGYLDSTDVFCPFSQNQQCTSG